MDGWSENFDWNPAGLSRRIFGWKFWNGFRLGESEGIWLKNVKVKRSAKRIEMWLGGPKEDVTWSNKRFWLGECVEWVLVEISGRPTDHRSQNQGCSLKCTKTPVLKDEICCWMYSMNTSELH